MRVFGRILFSVMAVGFFLLAFTYSRDLMMTKYLEDVFGVSLVDENSEYPEYYYFYTSIPNYHNNEPIISIDSNGYEIRGYEVLRTNINSDNELEVEENVYIIVYSDTEDLSKVDYLYLENQTNEETLIIDLQRFKTLNILNGINERGTVYIPKESFFVEDYDKIYLTDKFANLLIDEDFSLQEADFINKEFIEEFYQTNGRLPLIEDLDAIVDNHTFPNKPHVADDYAYIFYIAMGIYFTALIIATYFVYFKKPKKHY